MKRDGVNCGKTICFTKAVPSRYQKIRNGSRDNTNPQDDGGDSQGRRVNISCQYVNLREILDMKRRSKHVGGMPEFT